MIETKADRSKREVSLHPTRRIPTPYTDTQRACLDVADRDLQLVQVLLQLAVLLRHLLVLGLPLVPFRLQCLHLALVVTGLDIGLAEPIDPNKSADGYEG